MQAEVGLVYALRRACSVQQPALVPASEYRSARAVFAAPQEQRAQVRSEAQRAQVQHSREPRSQRGQAREQCAPVQQSLSARWRQAERLAALRQMSAERVATVPRLQQRKPEPAERRVRLF